ncbi:hypothetical protein [Salinimicrobium gaetbulicola]|uniref:PepSY-associated transmembrane protein n=1 Tax=Salinimicrobium gaetbulicola TaxID=999702 RepID=A0ABW3IBK2_9FLAO
MSKRILISIPIVLIIIGLIYFNLPFEVTRKTDIEFGNKLVERIEAFKKEKGQLPTPNDWMALEELGFKTEMLGTDPTYEKINENEFELIYLEGFDGPYLLYNSRQKHWKIDFPTIPDRWK